MKKPKLTKKLRKLSRTQTGITLTKEDRDVLDIEEDDLIEVTKHE